MVAVSFNSVSRSQGAAPLSRQRQIVPYFAVFSSGSQRLAYVADSEEGVHVLVDEPGRKDYQSLARSQSIICLPGAHVWLVANPGGHASRSGLLFSHIVHRPYRATF